MIPYSIPSIKAIKPVPHQHFDYPTIIRTARKGKGDLWDMPYNGYNESRKNSTLKYMKTMKIINLRIPKERYEQEIEPYIEKSGMKMATFIKARKSTRLNSSHIATSRMPSSACPAARSLLLPGKEA